MRTDYISRLAAAIANQEGFGAPGARPTRNHNPGDLRNWPGYPTDSGGFSIFPDDETGWAKLREDLMNHSRHYPDQTIEQFVSGDGDGWPGYAPASDHNDSAGYALALARAVARDTSATFAELSA